MAIYLSHTTALLHWLSDRGGPHGDAVSVQVKSPSDSSASLRELETMAPGLVRSARNAGRGPIHVLVDADSKRHASSMVTPHLWRGGTPLSSFSLLAPNLYVSSPEFTLVQLASHLDVVELAWTASLLASMMRPDLQALADTSPADARTSELDVTGPGYVEAFPLVTPESIVRFTSLVPGTHGIERLRKATGFFVGGAASPPELALAMMAAAPRRLGGYGLPKPQLNVRIDVTESAFRLCGRHSLYCDMLFPNKVVAEYDSNLYHAGTQALHKDRNRYNALVEMGFKPIALTAEHLSNTAMLDNAFKSIAHSTGRRVRPYEPFDRWRRGQLLKTLLDRDRTLLSDVLNCL